VTALREIVGRETCTSILKRASLVGYLEAAPSEMVSEREVARLFDALCRTLPPEASVAVLSTAGRNTADYILAHRIPMLAQRMIGFLPPLLGARVLMAAISKHAWTFAGSGTVTCDLGRNLSIGIACNSLATPGCPWHVAVFKRLFEVLVSPSVRIDHVSCCAEGDPICRTRVGCL
jgi:divinyl protochlorophyllide a 8-vinyl-reductase